MSKSAGGLVNKILDPLLAKRAGVSMSLIGAWSEIVGPELAEQSLPLKVRWPRRHPESDDFEPGVLLVAAEGAAALHLQHQTTQVIDRVNAFMGYRAIARIKLTQKPVDSTKVSKHGRPLTEAQKRKVTKIADSVGDDELKASLKRFGENVMRHKDRK